MKLNLSFIYKPELILNQEPKKKIAILATGGTIAGRSSDESDTTGYVPGSASIADILTSVPVLKDIAHIVTDQVSNIGSEDMTNDIWLKLAERTQFYLNDPLIDGVVITHGTDTLEETGFLLNLVLKTQKPVVLVGSMRPCTAISADGPMNIIEAVKVTTCEQARGAGVVVVMNDEINGLRDVTKTNTSNVDTFQSRIFGALGTVSGGVPYFFKKSVKPHTIDTEFSIEDIKSLPRVDIIYAHADQDSTLIDAAIESGTSGIVYAGFGNGSIHKNAFPGLLRATEKEIPVIRSSRTGSGLVVDSAEAWTQAGFINAGSLNPQKARILLQLALTKSKKVSEIKRIFETY